MTNPRTNCGEVSLRGGETEFGPMVCGAPAVAPHPVDGYRRPLCAIHLRIERTDES